ncbi:hypothetical protein A2U01_0072832, partial [Trifolium medium]|nr:hypothetical protein [Trifolium medium]
YDVLMYDVLMCEQMLRHLLWL